MLLIKNINGREKTIKSIWVNGQEPETDDCDGIVSVFNTKGIG